MTTPAAPPSAPPVWPEPGQPLPDAHAVLAPVIRFIVANFRIVPRKDVPPRETSYAGFPVRLDTCEDPEQLLGDEHLKLRASKGLPFADPISLLFYVAFQLGAEHARRQMRTKASGSGTARPARQTTRQKPPPFERRSW